MPTPRLYSGISPSIVLLTSFQATPSPVTEVIPSPVPTITPINDFSIRIVNFPEKVKLNDNTAFTWEINGPNATTGFTIIAGAKESKPGNLGEKVRLEDTPYRILVSDFTTGNYTIPLIYIGNTVLPEYGPWYFRALARVDGKNIWSDEHSLKVE